MVQDRYYKKKKNQIIRSIFPLDTPKPLRPWRFLVKFIFGYKRVESSKIENSTKYGSFPKKYWQRFDS